MRVKTYGLLVILQDKGNMLKEPYSKCLDDGIFELRCKFGNKTPPKEIRLDKERRADYLARMREK